MTRPEKLRVARALDELGVDVIEAGFPAASHGDFDSVQAVAREVQGPIICALARCSCRGHRARRARAVGSAPSPQSTCSSPPAPFTASNKLNMAQEEILRLCAAGGDPRARAVRGRGILPEDASRTELEFLAQVIEVAIAAGAPR